MSVGASAKIKQQLSFYALSITNYWHFKGKYTLKQKILLDFLLTKVVTSHGMLNLAFVQVVTELNLETKHEF